MQKSMYTINWNFFGYEIVKELPQKLEVIEGYVKKDYKLCYHKK